LDFELTLSSPAPIEQVRCLSHEAARTETLADGFAYRVKLEREKARLDRDLDVAFRLAREERPRLDVTAARRGSGRGAALLTLTPWLPAEGSDVARDVLIAVDTSAGMAA